MAHKMPNEGGCWFCHQDDEHEPLVFDCEFDTYVHRSCIQKNLDAGSDFEAWVMKYLLKEK